MTRTPSLMAILLVAAALAGCTGGTSNEPQPTGETPDGGSGTQTSQDRGPGSQGQRGRNHTYDASLEVSPENGTAPLNVTLTFGATWQDNGQRGGPAGNGTGGSSANRTTTGAASNGTGNGTGRAANANDGSHPVGPGHDVTWTLEVRLMSGGAAANGTAGGNETGNGTSDGNATTNSTTTSSSSTSTGPGGNGT
ncbi:MAG TPA: hypothetical protein VJ874_02210, partial [Candidatus Thermoplasmatota archaeon]|nr:hypothetical protein [Candidatus Thermoplasmatota archaeon]